MTIREALKNHKTPPLAVDAAVAAAEKLLLPKEIVRFAAAVSCVANKADQIPGVVVITSHRVLFSGVAAGSVSQEQLLFSDCLGVGAISKSSSYELLITSGSGKFLISGDKNLLAELQAAALDAVEVFPNQPDLTVPL